MRVIHEQVRHPDRAFRYLRFESDAFRGDRHRHRQLELTWIEAGVGMRFVGDSVEPFGPGDLVLLGPNLAHGWFSARRGAQRRVAATVLQFAPELLANPLLPELARLAPLARRAGAGLAIRGRAHREVTDLLVRMRSMGPVARLGALIGVLGVVEEHARSLRTIAGRVQPETPPADAPRGQRRIDLTIDHIHRHLDRELRVADLARVAHVSPAAFSRFFRRESGKTFTRYLNELRCGEAALRLQTGDRAIATVAAECGYTTLSNFNRQFRLRHGMTPGAYRARHRVPSAD